MKGEQLMINKYRKTALIEAEQVLGRAEAEHYQLALSWDPMRLDCGESWFPEKRWDWLLRY